MEFYRNEKFVILNTGKEFVIAFNEIIYGPYPTTDRVKNALVNILVNPENEKIMEEFNQIVKEEKYYVHSECVM